MKLFKGIGDSLSNTKFGSASRAYKIAYKKNKPLVTLILVGSYILGHICSGLAGSAFYQASGYIRHITVGTVLGYGFKWFPVTIVIAACFAMLWSKGLAKVTLPGQYDKEKGYTESDIKIGDSGTRMKDGEEKDATYKSSKYFEMTDIIFGRDIDHPDRLLTLNTDHRGMNNNIVVLGYPGCGKTRCWVIPILFQLIRKGESCVVTDTKADIYGYIWWVAKLHGYETRFLDFDIDSIRHSDGVDLFSIATQSDETCTLFAETVIANIGADMDDFWRMTGTNLLTAIMLLVKNDPSRTDKSFAEVRRTLNSNPTQLIAEFNTQRKEGSMLTTCADGFIAADKKVQDSTYSGLSIQLNMLSLPAIKKVVSEPEVDLRLPGKRPCIYFVNVSDRNRKLDFITSLFFDCLISELSSLADSNPKQCLDVPVTLLFEEFANIGRIPYWETKMNTLRSRKINSIMILQCREQLDSLYGESNAEAILNACAVQVLLGTQSAKTAKFYSDRSGKTTILYEETVNKESVQKGSILKLTSNETPQLKRAERPVYTLGEIYRLRHPRELVFTAQHNVCEMERLDRDNHPMTAEVRRIKALHHTPEWVKKLDPIDYEDYGIVIEEFKSDEELLSEGGWDMDVEHAYRCTPEDFMRFYHPEKREIVSKADEEGEAYALAANVDAVRETHGDSITLDTMEKKGLTDVFTFDDDEEE